MRLGFSLLYRIFFLGLFPSLLLCTASTLVFDQPLALAARKVVLKYGILQGSLSVSELVAFAETGKVAPSLQFYLSASRSNPQEVRQALTQEVKVNPLLLDRLLNTQIGEVLLDQVSQTVHTPSGKANRQALRSALLLSAAQDRKITLMETIQKYPTSEVEVNGDRLVQAFHQLNKLGGHVQDLLKYRFHSPY